MNRVNQSGSPRVAVPGATPLFLAVSLFFFHTPSVAAQDIDGFYISTNFGLTSAFGADVTAFGANHPTRCDRLLYANPASAPNDADCTAPPTSSRQGEFAFDRNSGRAQALALGYATGSLRLEAEFLLRQQVGKAAPFHRKSLDEGYLEVFGGSKSNPGAAPEWQRAAAGTLSMKDEPVNQSAFGYQLLAGVDRALGDRATAGLKARWTSVATVSASLPWTIIRSHRPVHVDGQTPYFWDYDFAGLGYLGVSLEMRYIF